MVSASQISSPRSTLWAASVPSRPSPPTSESHITASLPARLVIPWPAWYHSVVLGWLPASW